MHFSPMWFTFVFLLVFISPLGAITVHFKDGRTPVHIKSVHTTLGVHPDRPMMYNITLTRDDDFRYCNFTQPTALLEGRLFIYGDDLFSSSMCRGIFFDSIAAGSFFSFLAQENGAAAVLFRGSFGEEKYSEYIIAGFNKDVKIPALAATEDNIKFIVDNYDAIASIEIPPISNEDAKFIKLLQNVFYGLATYNAVVFALLALLLAWLTCADFKVYLYTNSNIRTLHTTLTKLVPCISSTCGAIWLSIDPFNLKLTRFPSLLFFCPFIGLMLVTCALLLKTLVLAVGKLKPPIVFKLSVWTLNTLAILMTIFTIVWIFVMNKSGDGHVSEPAIYLGAVLICVCGIGFIYYGWEIYVILSKGSSDVFQDLSKKIAIFILIFIICCYATFIIYFMRAFGQILSLFVMMVIIGSGFLAMYSLLFLRRSSPSLSTTPSSLRMKRLKEKGKSTRTEIEEEETMDG